MVTFQCFWVALGRFMTFGALETGLTFHDIAGLPGRLTSQVLTLWVAIWFLIAAFATSNVATKKNTKLKHAGIQGNG